MSEVEEKEAEDGGPTKVTIEQAFIDIIGTQNLQPFITDDFDPQQIFDLFSDNSTAHNDDDAEFLNTPESEQQFEKLVRDAILAARESGQPKALQGVLSTLGRASQKIAEDLQFDVADYIGQTFEENIPLTKPFAIAGKEALAVDVPRLINDIFAATDLHGLANRNLSQAEIQTIRQDFQADLTDLENTIRTDTEAEFVARTAGIESSEIRPDVDVFLFGQNTFTQLSNYITQHVTNPQLKQLLLADIQVRIAQDREKIGIQLGTAPPQITPLSANRVSVLRQDTGESISGLIGDQLSRITAAQVRLDRRGKRKKNRLQETQDQLVRSTVRTYNDFIERNRLRDRLTGELRVIPLEIGSPPLFPGPQQQLQPDLLSGSLAQVTAAAAPQINLPVDTGTLIEQLASLRDDFARSTQSFEFVPSVLTDVSSGQTREGIIQGLIEMDRRFKRASREERAPVTELQSTISRRNPFSNAEVRVGERRITGPTTRGAKMHEIRINKDITIGELAKIANSIIMESGSLEDLQENQLLSVRKGVTTVQDVVTELMGLVHRYSGRSFSVLFVPAHPLGGMFLHGALDAIQKNRMLVSPVGGDIFSSIFGAVGNVVKTVASVPLALAGAVFGGGLSQDSRAKPLFARNVSAPQHGGALAPGTFMQGEHMPEPFVSRELNQQFHILPFPFGGRIDNTGFISQAQRNPKFDLADVPVLSTTLFNR